MKFTSKIFTISGIANLQLLAGKPMRFVCCYIISDIKLAKPPVYRLIVFFMITSITLPELFVMLIEDQ